MGSKEATPNSAETELPKILITTRFSYFGISSWKSDFSTDPEMLFEENRLKQRLWLFENITIPSLVQQTDQDFHHFILSSKLMPKWARLALTELCEKHLNDARYTLRFAPAGPARKFQRFMIGDLTGAVDRPVAQVILDDDDALSSDFISKLKSKLLEIKEELGLDLESLPYFLTFPKGYALGLTTAETTLWHQTYPFINLGLTMIGSAEQRNILGISHRKAPKRFGFTHYNDQPMYVRGLNDANDSRVEIGERWRKIDHFQTNNEIKARFSFLLEIPYDEYYALPKPVHGKTK
jgi:hypothetical protein